MENMLPHRRTPGDTMKVTVKEAENTSIPENPFPGIYKRWSGTVVLFTATGGGFVLKCDDYCGSRVFMRWEGEDTPASKRDGWTPDNRAFTIQN